MKKVVYLATISCGLILGSCTLPQMIKMAKDQNLTASPNPLEVHKDTVSFELSATLPVKMLKPNTTYTLNLFYKHGDLEFPLDPIQFKSNDFPQSATRQPKINKKFTFPYDPSIKNGLLQVQGVASRASKSKSTPRLDVATGLNKTSKLVQNSYYVALADHGYFNQEEIVPQIIPSFYFDQGSSTLRPSDITGMSGQQLDAFIAAKNVTRTVTIIGTHSPEGRERVNSQLSQERAAAIEKFYRDEMKKYDYQRAASEIKFVLKPVVDDWTDFKNALKNYDKISASDKAAYMNIINAGGTFPEVELKLKQLPTYEKVYSEIYPELRAAKTEVYVLKKKRSEVDIAVLSKQILIGSASGDALGLDEFLFAASLTPSLEEKASLYQFATKLGSSWIAHNNLAATWLTMGLQDPSRLKEYAEKASTQLEIASRLNNSNEVTTNMATVALIQGNPWKASILADKVLKDAGNDVVKGLNGVKACSEIYMGKYAQAAASAMVAEPNKTNLFNRGLAQLLNKDYSNASKSFTEAIKKDNKYALAYYGAAITAARQGNEKDLFLNLSEAVKHDTNLKDIALNDIEFNKWSSGDTFRNTLK